MMTTPTPFKTEDVYRRIDILKAAWKPMDTHILKHEAIHTINLEEHKDIDNIKFHYTLMNNGRSIEEEGLRSSVGVNSENIDSEEAIYFSWGICGVLNNWDVWLKWRLSQLYNPIAAQQTMKCSAKDAMKYAGLWYDYISSKEYRKDTERINTAFAYEKAELSSSYYFSLELEEGVDFDPEQIDPKKEIVRYSEYACEIYGAGYSTNVESMNAEKWNMSTPLGKHVTISPARIDHLITNKGETALDVLTYLYNSYMVYCDENGLNRPHFVLLDKFIAYCNV